MNCLLFGDPTSTVKALGLDENNTPSLKDGDDVSADEEEQVVPTPYIKKENGTCPTEVELIVVHDKQNWNAYDPAKLDCYNFGDLIEFERGGYPHWAMYTKKGKVVHFKPEGGELMEPVNGNAWYNGDVSITDLELLADRDRIRILKDDQEARTKHEIKNLIKAWVGSSVFKYSLLNFNSEHFVNLLKYGKVQSTQINPIVLADLQNREKEVPQLKEILLP